MLISYNGLCRLVDGGAVRNMEPAQINAASIDVRIGGAVLVEQSIGGVISLKNREKPGMYEAALPYLLAPGEFILAATIEEFYLPDNIAAQFQLKSSGARMGLEHLKAGWCFVGSTEIPLLDGTSARIDSLVGKMPWVYSLDELGEVVPGQVLRVWESARVRRTVVVTLDSGATFECTPEHRVMLRSGGYCEAQHLQPGTALATHLNNKRWGTPIPEEYKNHKVLSTQIIRHARPVPVYDMTVDTHHNFAIAAGVFAHNCDPGWNGSKLTLELKNMNQHHSILLQEGDRIGQLVFFQCEPVPVDKSYAVRGHYNNDKTVSAAKPAVKS